MDQTVNLTSSTSVVQIHLFPPQKRVKTRVFALFCAIFCPFWRIFMCLPPNLPPKFFPINTRPTPRFFAPFRVSLLRRTRLSFAFHHRGGECFTPSVLPRHATSSPALQSKRRGALNRLRPRRYNDLPTSDSVAGSLIPCSLYP